MAEYDMGAVHHGTEARHDRYTNVWETQKQLPIISFEKLDQIKCYSVALQVIRLTYSQINN